MDGARQPVGAGRRLIPGGRAQGRGRLDPLNYSALCASVLFRMAALKAGVASTPLNYSALCASVLFRMAALKAGVASTPLVLRASA